MRALLVVAVALCAAAVVAEEAAVKGLEEEDSGQAANSWADAVIGKVSDAANAQRKAGAGAAKADLQKMVGAEEKAKNALHDLDKSDEKLLHQPVVNQASILGEVNRVEGDISKAEIAESRQYDWMIKSADDLSRIMGSAFAEASTDEQQQLGEGEADPTDSGQGKQAANTPAGGKGLAPAEKAAEKAVQKKELFRTSRAEKMFQDEVILQKLASQAKNKYAAQNRDTLLKKMMEEAKDVAIDAKLDHKPATEWHLAKNQPQNAPKELGENDATTRDAITSEEKKLHHLDMNAEALESEESKEMDFIDYLYKHLQID